MTLVLRASFNGGDYGSYVIASADTRMVMKPFNTKTLEYSNVTLELRDDITDKVIQISKNVLFNHGGMQMIYTPFADYVIKRAKDDFFLDDFELIFKEAYAYLKENGTDAFKKYIDSEYNYLGLIGFFKNGNPGELILQKNGEIFKQDINPVGYNARMFAPTEDIMNNDEELLNFKKSPFWNENDIMTTMVDHFLYLHSIIASKEVERVSDKCIIHIINKNQNGEISYHNASYDLEEQVKQFQIAMQDIT